jgi:hypothetical protein
VAEVNSLRRAERLRAEIGKRLGAAAVHQNTAIVTQEEMMRNANQRESHVKNDDDAEAAVLRDPEVRRQLQARVQEEVEAWVHKKLPVLGGRTPLQAVNDPDGGEIVAVIVGRMGRQMKRQTYKCSPPIAESLSADNGLNNERL